jgi:hypothetical protein
VSETQGEIEKTQARLRVLYLMSRQKPDVYAADVEDLRLLHRVLEEKEAELVAFRKWRQAVLMLNAGVLNLPHTPTQLDYEEGFKNLYGIEKEG